MERQVKERIVGAAVLVALGVWLFPWILNGPDEYADPVESLPEIILPTAEEIAPVRTETVELERRAQTERAPEVAAPSEVFETEPLAVSANPAPPDEADQQPAPERPEPELQPAAEPEVAASAAPTTAPAPAAAGGGWVVQLGAFGEAANARQLAGRVSNFGFTAVVSELRTGGQTMHRVRVEGFDSRNEADAAASSLSAHGLPVRVIPPE